MKLSVVAEKWNQEQVNTIVEKLTDGTTSKGAVIRELFAGGLEVKEISEATGIRYNHVYNVVKNEVLKNGLEVEKSERNGENSKKSQIIKLLQEGKTMSEVAQTLGCLYNYVWQTAKNAGLTKQDEKVSETPENEQAAVAQ